MCRSSRSTSPSSPAPGCMGVMCGHIHTPADKVLGGIHYLNSGDWIESMTAIVEHWDGRYELVEYSDFLREFPVAADDLSGDQAALDSEAPEEGTVTRLEGARSE